VTNCLIVGGPTDWIEGAFQKKLNAIDYNMVAHWPARKQPPAEWPKKIEIALFLVDFLGHSLRNKVKAMAPSDCPIVEIPFRRWSIALEILKSQGRLSRHLNLLHDDIGTPRIATIQEISRLHSQQPEMTRENCEIYLGKTIDTNEWREMTLTNEKRKYEECFALALADNIHLLKDPTLLEETVKDLYGCDKKLSPTAFADFFKNEERVKQLMLDYLHEWAQEYNQRERTYPTYRNSLRHLRFVFFGYGKIPADLATKRMVQTAVQSSEEWQAAATSRSPRRHPLPPSPTPTPPPPQGEMMKTFAPPNPRIELLFSNIQDEIFGVVEEYACDAILAYYTHKMGEVGLTPSDPEGLKEEIVTFLKSFPREPRG